jgi:Domain of unknown function (DUF4383)
VARAICRIIGVLFVITGTVVVVRGAEVDPYHNGLHIVTGIIALYFGFAGSASAAKNFCLVAGVSYLAFGLLGLLLGDPVLNRTWHVGPLHLNTGDHIFHVVLGLILTAPAVRGGIPLRQRRVDS